MRKWSSIDLDYLIGNYSGGESVQNIASYLNRSLVSVLHKATYLNLKRGYKYYKKAYNEFFFDENNWTKELAYVVGIVVTDGHVSKLPKKYISIVMCDKDVLEKLAGVTGYSGSILTQTDGNIKHSNSYYIRFCGDKIWKFFTKLGLDHRKSYTAVLPIIPNEFMSHFLRGVCDGDGCISIDKLGNPRVEISGTKQFIEGIIDTVSIKGSFYSKPGGNTYCIRYTSKNAFSFLNLIYCNSVEPIRMNRKYSRYSDVLNIALQKGWR